MSSTVYLFDPSINNLKNHVLTNGVASIGDNSYNITSTNILNVNGNSRANGAYYSNFNNGKAMLLPADTSANRPPIGIPGYVRLNTTFNALEYYNSNSWYPIYVVPNLTSITPTFVTVSNQDISLNGTNFLSGAIVTFIDGSNNQYPSPVTTFYNNNYISAKTPTTGLPASSTGYSIRITNPNGIPSTLYNALFTTGTIYFITPPGSIGNIYALSPNNYSLLPVTAVDVNSNPLTYSIISGSLPSGLTLNASNGAITGNYTGGVPSSDTVYNFTVKAQNSLSVFATRAFSITVKAIVTTSFSSQNAAAYFTVPAGVINIKATMWGGGGGAYFEPGGYPDTGSAGGAGGFTQTTFNVITSDSNTLTIIVGGGGNPNAGSPTSSYGGGGSAANGGASGGGCSAILGGNITSPYIYQTTSTSPRIYYTWVPQSNLLALAGATGVVAVAGGGGGASWYPSSDNYANGGCGGGLNGYSAVQGLSSSSYATPGGTQIAGGSNSGADSSTSGSKFLGGYLTNNNGSTGGAAGGGGGWYGGGSTQFLSGGDSNSGGGGGSGFIGYVNGSLSSVLTPTSGNNYQDSFTRTNGQRTYTNSTCWGVATPTGAAGTTSPYNSGDPNYQSGIGTGAPYGISGGGAFGGNGLVVLQY